MSLPGLDLASAMSSPNVLTGTLSATTSNSGTSTTCVSSFKSLCTSYGIASESTGVIASGPALEMPRV